MESSLVSKERKKSKSLKVKPGGGNGDATAGTDVTAMPDLKETKLSALIEEMQFRGYFIARRPDKVRGKVFKADLARWGGGSFKFGVISCTHLGSRYQQLTHLYNFYGYCKQQGIDSIYHCGDLTDGENMYKGHVYEIFMHGADGQTRYAIETYPKVEGIKTYVISGNHDLSYRKSAGYNIVSAVAKERSDIEFLGDDLAYTDMLNIRVGMMHAEGGVAYARSYKPQKIVEAVAPEMKPHFFFIGHWHVAVLIPGYRNVETVSMGCFQSQTPYLVTKGLQPVVSGLIVEVTPDKYGLAKVTYEWVPFFKHKKNDF